MAKYLLRWPKSAVHADDVRVTDWKAVVAQDQYNAEADGAAPIELSDAAVHERELDLRAGLTQLSDLVTEALSLPDLLGEVARAAVDAIPGTDMVGLTLLRMDSPGGRIQTLAASHDLVERIDLIQYELVDEGPCITAARDRQAVVADVVGKDPRWPRFGPRVARLGVRSVLSLPLLLRDGTAVGALNCYSSSSHVFDSDAVRIGGLFAAPAAVAVHNSQALARAQAHAAQLRVALNSRAIIDQAIGILRSRSGASAEEAFTRLRERSQSENIKLAAVAERLVEESVRRARARHVRDGVTEDDE